MIILVWNWKKNSSPFVKLASFCITHITSQIYFFHISSMKCDSIHFNIMSDIVWSFWSENREKRLFFVFVIYLLIDWCWAQTLASISWRVLHVIITICLNGSTLCTNRMHQQTSIICKQNIHIKQIYYFRDSFTLKELSNMKY